LGASRAAALSSYRTHSWSRIARPIIVAAARNNVPAVYPDSPFARDGGLLSYGVDLIDNVNMSLSAHDPKRASASI
jgi:hypothetical protein